MRTAAAAWGTMLSIVCAAAGIEAQAPPRPSGDSTRALCPADVRVPSDQCTRHGDVAFSPDAPSRGLVPTFRAIADVSQIGGAARPAAIGRALISAGAVGRVSLRPNWPAITVRLAAQWRPGPTSSDFVGDLQALSNIDAPAFARISDVWIELPLAGALARTKIGHFDLNQDYAFAEAAAPFSHSAFSFSQNIVALPTYPLPATGAHLFVTPRRGAYLKVGVADGAGGSGGIPRPRLPWSAWRGRPRFVIAEVGADNSPLTKDRLARLAVGAWGHDGEWARSDGSIQHGTRGVYVIGEGTLWDASRGQDDRAFASGFVMAALADSRVSRAWQHVGAGVTAFGLARGRPDDVIGLGASWMRLSPVFSSGGSELAVEGVWRLEGVAGFSWAPTLVLIRNPGGAAPGRWARILSVRVVWHSSEG